MPRLAPHRPMRISGSTTGCEPSIGLSWAGPCRGRRRATSSRCCPSAAGATCHVLAAALVLEVVGVSDARRLRTPVAVLRHDGRGVEGYSLPSATLAIVGSPSSGTFSPVRPRPSTHDREGRGARPSTAVVALLASTSASTTPSTSSPASPSALASRSSPSGTSRRTSCPGHVPRGKTPTSTWRPPRRGHPAGGRGSARRHRRGDRACRAWPVRVARRRWARVAGEPARTSSGSSTP